MPTTIFSVPYLYLSSWSFFIFLYLLQKTSFKCALRVTLDVCLYFVLIYILLFRSRLSRNQSCWLVQGIARHFDVVEPVSSC
jgi:hypothetical protein